MSLEARIEMLTSAIIELTAAIGGMQAPGPVEVIAPGGVSKAEIKKAFDAAKEATEALTPQARTLHDRLNEETPNVQPDTTSGQPSAPTGESFSPEVFEGTEEDQKIAHDKGLITYNFAVKTITLALSKAKGPETTKAILAKFDVASAKQLVAGQWAAYIEACNEAMA